MCAARSVVRQVLEESAPLGIRDEGHALRGEGLYVARCW